VREAEASREGATRQPRFSLTRYSLFVCALLQLPRSTVETALDLLYSLRYPARPSPLHRCGFDASISSDLYAVIREIPDQKPEDEIVRPYRFGEKRNGGGVERAIFGRQHGWATQQFQKCLRGYAGATTVPFPCP
jgi:hypothetical protein